MSGPPRLVRALRSGRPRVARRAIAAVAGLAAVAALAATWGACAIYDTTLLLPAPDAAPPPVDSSTDADTCAHARWPARPAVDDPSPGSTAPFVTALRTLDIGVRRDGGAEPVYGFDLDGVCTCPGLGTCRVGAGLSTTCDQPGGRDNAGGALLRAFGSLDVFDQDKLNERLREGGYGLLVQVRDYNGQANDTKVTLAVFVSNGIEGIETSANPPPPTYDGNDAWTLDPASLLAGDSLDGVDCGTDTRCAPLYFDADAYVADHVLVGSLDVPLSLGGGEHGLPVVLNLVGSVVTARLRADSGSYSLDGGQIAGRWPTAKLLSSLAVVMDPLSPARYLCGDDPTYLGIKSRICAAADVASAPSLDSLGAECDAISIALGFTASPARLGKVYRTSAPTVGCNDGGAPVADDCPHP